MNAYELRKKMRQEKTRIRYLKLKDMKLHQISMTERYYISAFTALNGQPPLSLPKTGDLVSAADILFATAHAIELGGDDE